MDRPQLSHSSHRILLRTIAIAVAVLASLAAAVAGILAPYCLAIVVSRTALLVGAAILSFAVVAWLGLRAAAALWRASNPSRLALMTSVALTAVFFSMLYVLVLRTHSLRYTEVVPAENARVWHLPTGSTISYQEYLPPAGIDAKLDPIVFLHGGPGIRFAPFDSEIYSRFAADGFRVYLYDQAGSGASEFLPHIRDYSIARSVEDLEAIRRELHADRMILIGHSFGSTLAASYMARYPTHVSKVVFHSPAGIWKVSGDPVEFERTEAGGPQIGLGSFPLRLMVGLFLMQQNPDAAERLLSQREAEDLWAPVMARTVKALVCKGDSASLPPLIAGLASERDNPGFNPYVMQRLADETDESSKDDPHAALKGNSTPAILLFGECNYVPWRVTGDYRHTFSNLKVVYFPRAGHYIQFEGAEMMTKVVRGFLLGEMNALPVYSSDADPRVSATQNWK